MCDLDATDVRILDVLQEDASISIAALAERVASSKTAVWRRVQRMTEAGIIRGQVSLVDHHKVGLRIMVFAHIKMSRHNREVLPNFLDAIRGLPPVIECHTLMGDVDFLLKIVVPSIEFYEHFVWNKLSKIDGVEGISSSISMSQSVNSTRLPIDIALEHSER